MLISIFLEGGKMRWLIKLFGLHKTIDQKLRSDYTYFVSLGLTLGKEWQKDENMALLSLEETGIGG